jgi:hypothetical protein
MEESALCVVLHTLADKGQDCSLYAARSIIMTLEMTIPCSTHHESGICLHMEACTPVSWCVRMRHTQYRQCDAQSSVTHFAQVVVSDQLF